jgi:hypothetical protein
MNQQLFALHALLLFCLFFGLVRSYRDNGHINIIQLRTHLNGVGLGDVRTLNLASSADVFKCSTPVPSPLRQQV